MNKPHSRQRLAALAYLVIGAINLLVGPWWLGLACIVVAVGTFVQASRIASGRTPPPDPAPAPNWRGAVLKYFGLRR